NRSTPPLALPPAKPWDIEHFRALSDYQRAARKQCAQRNKWPRCEFHGHTKGTKHMLKWALIFLVISLVSGYLGFSGVSAATATIAKVLFFIALALFLIFVLLAFTA